MIQKSNLDIFPGYAAYLREAAKDPATKKSIDELHKRHGMDKFIDLDTMSFKPEEAAPSSAPEAKKTAEQRAAELKAIPGMTKEKFTETLRSEGYVK